MTKEQLKEMQDKIEQLENDVDYWVENSNSLEIDKEQLEMEIDNLKYKLEGAILDIDNFKFKLKINGLLSSDLEKFIEDYIKYERVVD